MKVKNTSLLLGLGLFFISSNEVLALENNDIYNYTLSSYSERYLNSSKLEAFLKSKGISSEEYKNYLKKLNNYANSNELHWEQLENHSILIDEILFSDLEVKKEYDKALKLLGSKDLAYNFVKRNLINNPSLFTSKFENTIKDEQKMIEIFKKEFNREPFNNEKKWLSDPETVKLALYSGTLNENFTRPLIDIILDENKGFYGLGLSESDIETYMDFVKEREKFDNLHIEYVKNTALFEGIAADISSKYAIDIFTQLSYKDRMTIYNKSIDGFIFDESKSLKLILELLVKKGILSQNQLDSFENNSNPLPQINSKPDPWSELNEKLKSRKSKNKSLDDLYRTIGIQSFSENLSSGVLFVKYKDLEFNTNIRLNKDKTFYETSFNELLSLLEAKIELKTIFSKKELLTYLENKISTFDHPVNEKSEITFNIIRNIFKDIGVEIYEKDINFNENNTSIFEDENLTNETGKQYKASISLEDKEFTFNLGEDKNISIIDIQTMIDYLDASSVLSMDSILVLKDNDIKISKIINIKDEYVTLENTKKLLEELGEKVNIQIIEDISEDDELV